MKETSKTKGEKLALVRLEKEVLNLPERVKKIKVKDKPSLDQAYAELVYIKSVRRNIGNFCNPNISRLNVAHKEAVAQKRTFERPLIEAEAHLNPQISSYLAKLEQIRKEAEERARIEREAAERKAREKEGAKLRKAREAEEMGDLKKAKKILDREPIGVPFVPRVSVPPKEKLQGVSTRRDWKWEAKNFKEVPREFKRLILDDKKITDHVRLFKEKAKIPGIKIFFKDTLLTRLG